MNDSRNQSFDNSIQKNRNFLRRTAMEAKKYSVRMRLCKTLLMALVVLVTIIYIVSVLYMKTGSFTVNLNKFDAQEYGLSLSEKKYAGDKTQFAAKTSNLNADIAEYMTNISEDSIPADVDMIDGVHNGDNYIAYSFYLVNTGEHDVTYEYSIVIKNITNGLDTAIRVRLYVDGEYTTYARTRSDGMGAEPGTVEFESATTIISNRIDAFEPGSSHRYTVVVWIEGNDPDCVDALIGGTLKLDMIFRVVY